MRIQFINNQIAMGGAIRTADALQQVINKRITHMIDLDYQCDSSTWSALEDKGKIEVLHYHLPDDGNPKPYRYFVTCVEFALDVLKNPHNKLFVHCAAGRSRSVSIVYAILRAMGNSKKEAKNIIGFKYSLALAVRDKNFKAIRRIRYEDDVEIFIERYNDSIRRQNCYLVSKELLKKQELAPWVVRSKSDILFAIDAEIDKIELVEKGEETPENYLCKCMHSNCLACPFTMLRKIIDIDYSTQSYEMLRKFVQVTYPETSEELIWRAKNYLDEINNNRDSNS